MVAGMAMNTIGETGITDETVVGEEGGEGGEAIITEAGTDDRHTGIGIVMTEDLYLPVDTRDTDGVGRGALHREGLEAGVFHEGTTEPGVLLVPTRMGPRLQHSQPGQSHWNRARMSLGGISDPVRLTPNQLQSNLYPRFQRKPRSSRSLRWSKVPLPIRNWQPRPPLRMVLKQRPQCRSLPMNPGQVTQERPKDWIVSISPPLILHPPLHGRR